MLKKDKSEKLLRGKISINSKGIGFLMQENVEEDIEIAPEDTYIALSGDEVNVKLTGKKSERGRKLGAVVEVITRKQTSFVGTSIRESGVTFGIADSRKIHVPFVLINANVEPGYKILFELLDWKNPNEAPTGKLIEIIGKKGDNDAEMASIALERGFKSTFPHQVENEAKKIKDGALNDMEQEILKRRDFRKTLTCTIDPKDAKDFDDAISFKKINDNLFEIGIHIADVSHYLTPKSELDKEAQKRGVSVYLVDRTIPMLPEILSNDLCSLNPNEDKLTFSAVFEVDYMGHVYNSWFGKTIIHSDKRFTYEEAQTVIETGEGHFGDTLKTLNSIAKELYKKREEKGAISFEQDEVKFELDDAGKPIRVFRKVRLDAHKLVEEFMLLANREVAIFVNKKYKEEEKGSPLFLYRIHDTPDKDRIAELSIFLKAIGYSLPIEDGSVTGNDLNALFKKIEGEAEEGLIKTTAIRSMAKAIYSINNIGHFGLSFDYYTHFTSPIRRYPDVLVHRLLQKHLLGEKIPQQEFAFYENMASQNTESEIKAAEAERESIKLKQVEYMSNKINQPLSGIISGITDWGVYIEEKETKAEGLLKLRDLNDDYYRVDAKNYCIVGEKTGKRIRLGDNVKFKFSAFDIEKKTLDCKLIAN